MADVTELFEWTAQREEAALLVAHGQLSDAEIGERVGVGQRTIVRWKAMPAFQERVSAIVENLRRALFETSILERAARLRILDELNHRLLMVMQERGAVPEMAQVPGGKTGLLTRTHKMVGRGPESRLMEEWDLDKTLLQEVRAVLEQTSREKGDWLERHDLTSDGERLALVPWEPKGNDDGQDRE